MKRCIYRNMNTRILHTKLSIASKQSYSVKTYSCFTGAKGIFSDYYTVCFLAGSGRFEYDEFRQMLGQGNNMRGGLF